MPLPSWDFNVNQRRVLLPAVSVAVARIALEDGARDRYLDRERIVAEENLHLFRLEAVALRDHFAAERARSLYAFVDGSVVEHDIERQLERPGVLAADQSGNLGE